MPASNRKPSTGSDAVDFDFDAWEQDDAPRPFEVRMGGKVYLAVNPMELDFREFDVVEDDAHATFRMLFPNDHKAILANKVIKAGALQEFNQKVLKHYGVGNIAGS